MGKTKIGFVSEAAPTDKSAWSGTTNKLYEQIFQCDVEVVWIPFKVNFLSYCYKVFLFIITRLTGKRYSFYHTIPVARQISRSVDRKLLESVDLLFLPGGSCILYELETDKPIIYLTDATFASLYNYYPLVSNFLPFNVRQGNLLEQKALDKAWRIIVSSDWCKESVVRDYSIDPSKVVLIEFGANVEEKDIPEQKVHFSGGKLNLLFLGVDWDRKGGDVAVDCVEALNRMGIPSVLHVMGTDVPQKHEKKAFIQAHGFLRKSDPEEYRQFISVIRQSDLLLLPTRAECSAIAFCEASAYGLPIITYDTGGIPSYVGNGVNGYRLPLSAGGEEFAARIQSVMEKKELPRLVEGCRTAYADRLNWRKWRERFERLIHSNSIP